MIQRQWKSMKGIKAFCLRKASLALISMALLTLGIAPPASAIPLITNGDFETGDFTGWSVADLAGGSGSFFIDNADGFTPFSGHLTVGPASGSFYAYLIKLVQGHMLCCRRLQFLAQQPR